MLNVFVTSHFFKKKKEKLDMISEYGNDMIRRIRIKESHDDRESRSNISRVKRVGLQ